MFERVRLLPNLSNVNLIGLFCLILFLPACGPTNKEEETRKVFRIASPLIWQTEPIFPVFANFTLGGNDPTVISVGYKNNGVQIYNLDGKKIGLTSPDTSTQFASGIGLRILSVNSTIFPAINDESQAVIYLHGKGLTSPVELTIDNLLDEIHENICSTDDSKSDTPAIKVGLITVYSNIVRFGTIEFPDGQSTLFKPSYELNLPGLPTHCALSGSGAVVAGKFGITFARDDKIIATHQLTQGIQSLTLMKAENLLLAIAALDDGRVWAIDETGLMSPVTFLDGMTIKAPDKINLVRYIPDTHDPAFSNGILALADTNNPDDRRIRFADPGAIQTQIHLSAKNQ